MLAARGCGAPEIGGLLLLIAGPFLLWWKGPIFGIILVRSAANRWSDRTEHVATVLVFTLLAVQALLAVALVGYALITGGWAAAELQRAMSGIALLRPVDISADAGLLLVVRISGWLLAPIAGLSSGIYLALSPRHRG